MGDPDRQSAKREKTRRALLSAVRDLVYESGHERIAIQDITMRAGVGLGTFYNYFESRDCIFEGVLDNLRQDFQQRLGEIRQPLKDVAATVAVTLRYSLLQAQDNVDFRTFVTYCGPIGNQSLLPDPDQLLSDLQRGVRAGRFKVDDVPFALQLVLGMLSYTYREIAEARLGRKAMDDTTRYALRMLGLSDPVAKALVQIPLPVVPVTCHAARLPAIAPPDLVQQSLAALPHPTPKNTID